MTHSPARILASYIMTQGLFDSPGGASAEIWPLFIGHMPDATDIPVTVAAIYDQEGRDDGRLMSGHYIKHPGIQILIRARDYDAGYAKAKAVEDLLKEVRGQVSVTLESIDYTILNASQQGSIASLGVEPGTRRGKVFSLNFLMTLATSDDIPPISTGGEDSMAVFNHTTDEPVVSTQLRSFNDVHTNFGAGSSTVRLSLSPAEVAKGGTFIQVDPGQFIIEPDPAEYFETSMGDLAVGQAYVLNSAVSKIRIVCYEPGSWVIEDESGTTGAEE